MDWLKSILEYIFTPVLVIAAVAWVFRSLFKQILSKNIEKFKSELSLIVSTHDIRYKKIYDRQADVVADVYGKMSESMWVLNQMQPLGTGEHSVQDAQESLMNLRKYYLSNEIFFDEQTRVSINQLINKMSLVFKKIADNETRSKKAFTVEEIKGIILNDLYEAMEAVEINFHRYIDTSDGNSQKKDKSDVQA